MADDMVASVSDAFERALNDIEARVFVSAPPAIAVAYSGGLDSSVLLDLARRYAAVRGISLLAFHVHHGLSPNADAWLDHCERECGAAGIAFDVRRVKIVPGNSIEQAARMQRYAALGDLCTMHGVPLLLTAHHLDDQAETVLLQLLRGSGVAGLGGMEPFSRAPDLLNSEAILIARPLLQVSRTALEAYIRANGIRHIDDESNGDVRFARNALRRDVMPAIAQHFPGFADRLGRSAQHARSAQRLIDQLAAQDLAACREGECLNLSAVFALDADRADNLFRYWFAMKGVRMPSTAWLAEMRQQLASRHDDAQICITHPDIEVRRYQGLAYMVPRHANPGVSERLAFAWMGEASIDFPSFGGRLHFVPTGKGIGLDADWLRGQRLMLHRRRGGERLKTATDRPTRSLKHHYQALRIPAWERARLPLVSTNASQLLFAAGIGMNVCNAPRGDVAFRWEDCTP